MYTNIIAWAGLGLLFIFCLPFARVQRFLLTLYGLSLRIAMLGLVCAAAWLWFHPEQLPSQVADSVRNTYVFKSILPDPGRAIFPVCAVSLIALIVLPLLTVLDASRKAVDLREDVMEANRSRIANAPVVASHQPPPAPVATTPPAPPPSRFGRRAAASTMTQAGS